MKSDIISFIVQTCNERDKVLRISWGLSLITIIKDK